MSQCDLQFLVEAYHDGELDSTARRQVAAHLAVCTACAAALRSMRELSSRIDAAMAGGAMDAGDSALEGLHAAVEREMRDEMKLRPLLRTAGMLGALAASVLIVGGVWLCDFDHGGAVGAGSGDGRGDTQISAIAPDWERVAVTLRAEPRPAAGGESPFAPHYAEAIHWMLEGLKTSEGG